MAYKKDPLHKTFAANFNRIKKEKKIDNANILYDTGISYPNLWHYSQGNAIPQGERLVSLAKSLGVSVGELLGVK